MENEDFKKLSKKELLDIVENLQSGTLLWNKQKENIIEEYFDKIPVLENIKKFNIFNPKNKNTNLLIESDNYEGLGAILNLYKNKIDFIYIDPPYNTGKDFIYKDKLVAADDPFKHSKWLSFMEPRIILAYELLSQDGILICSINDIELEYLKLILNKIFKKQNTEILIWHKPVKMKQTNTFKGEHEYLLVAYKSKVGRKLNRPKRIKKLEKTKVQNPDNDPRGDWFTGELTKSEIKWNEESKKFYSVKKPNGEYLNAEFLVSKEEFKKLEVNNEIWWTKDGTGLPRRKKWPNIATEKTPSSVLNDEGFTQTDGNRDLENIFGKSHEEIFQNPKPVELIKWLIEICSKNDSIVLDFFAGSGTTAQAVLELNRDTDSDRKSIMITNNENNIATDVTHKRISSVINGFKGFNTKEKHEACNENLLYYRVNPVSDEKNDFSLKELAKYQTDTIFLIEETHTEIIKNDDYLINKNNQENYTIILFDIEKLEEALSKIPNSDLILNIYFFTLDTSKNFKNETKLLPNQYKINVNSFPIKMKVP
jgi:adenine-specific DNA-methyltransferase